MRRALVLVVLTSCQADGAANFIVAPQHAVGGLAQGSIGVRDAPCYDCSPGELFASALRLALEAGVGEVSNQAGRREVTPVLGVGVRMSFASLVPPSTIGARRIDFGGELVVDGVRDGTGAMIGGWVDVALTRAPSHPSVRVEVRDADFSHDANEAQLMLGVVWTWKDTQCLRKHCDWD